MPITSSNSFVGVDVNVADPLENFKLLIEIRTGLGLKLDIQKAQKVLMCGADVAQGDRTGLGVFKNRHLSTGLLTFQRFLFISPPEKIWFPKSWDFNKSGLFTEFPYLDTNFPNYTNVISLKYVIDFPYNPIIGLY